MSRERPQHKEDAEDGERRKRCQKDRSAGSAHAHGDGHDAERENRTQHRQMGKRTFGKWALWAS
jgi:hypothetical protein